MIKKYERDIHIFISANMEASLAIMRRKRDIARLSKAETMYADALNRVAREEDYVETVFGFTETATPSGVRVTHNFTDVEDLNFFKSYIESVSGGTLVCTVKSNPYIICRVRSWAHQN